MIQQLNEHFLLELYKSCLTSKSFLEVVIKHLKFHYIPEESYKKIFEKIVIEYELQGSVPTIGSLTQHFSQAREQDDNVLKVLVKIKSVSVVDQKDIILQTFEKFIINAMFHDLYRKMGELHNEGKQAKAIKMLADQAPIISNFSIKGSTYSKVYGGYNDRQADRKSKNKDQLGANKVTFGIHALDFFTRGGMDKGTSTLFLARSGGGKSTILRWIGMCASRAGMKVVHFQGEGTEKEALDAYDAGWSSVDLEDIEFGQIPTEKIKKVEKAHRDLLASQGEVYVKASESFDDLTVHGCRDILEDIEKNFGKIDLVIFDYLEIFGVDGKYFNSETGERKRREDIANKMTNIATAFNVAVATATQANDIAPEKYNNPEFVLTRTHISEFKGALKPFSNFITINQTDDEYDNGIVRLHNDKFRKYKAKQTVSLAQSLNNSRFYDAKKSLDMFWDEKKGESK
jgi:replicative DNA helicase